MKDVNLFLEHILDSIKDVELFLKGVSKEKFLKNKEKQYAVIRGIEIIGEAVKNIPYEFRRKHKDIPWKEIAGMRDRLIHHYFGVNLERVWNVIKKDLPDLKESVSRILLK